MKTFRNSVFSEYMMFKQEDVELPYEELSKIQKFNGNSIIPLESNNAFKKLNSSQQILSSLYNEHKVYTYFNINSTTE